MHTERKPEPENSEPGKPEPKKAIPKNPEAKGHLRPRPLRLKIHGWLRWLHTYISMFSLIAILFFSLTGVTLNHPDWAFTNSEHQTKSNGTLPAEWKKGKEVDWFVVSEYLRQKGKAAGAVTSKEADESEATITFKAPGYTADCFIEPNGKYELTVTTLGFVGVMNDFHRGRDSGPIWPRLIDISGITLTLVALTGLGLLWYLKKIRLAGFIVVAVGGVLVFIAMGLAF